MLTVLCGGVGAARFLAGLAKVVDPSEITAVVNVGDDLVVHGLRISPDLDTIIYTLAGLHNDATGWGVVDESWRVMDELASIGGPTWFGLGDRDLATHLYRTGRLRDGATLSVVTAELARARGVRVHVVPASDDESATVITTTDGEQLSFQEYFVERRHAVAVASISFSAAASATATPGVLDAVRAARRVIVAPSNPLLSIDPILAIPGIRAALAERRSDTVAISPIIAGAALRGPAARLLGELGHEATALGVARHYADIAGTFVIDHDDVALKADVERLDVRCVVTDTVMRDAGAASALAAVVCDG